MKEIRIGQNIAVLRKKSHTTQDQLAQALHLSPQAVSKWENGVSYPDTQTMAMIADYFHVTIDFLYYGKAEDEMQENEYKGIRAKDRYPNWLIYSYWKEDELNSLTDEEFAILRSKVVYRIRTIAQRNTKFEEFFAGKKGEAIKGNGNAADLYIYQEKSMADSLGRSYLYSLYERVFTFVHRLGVRNIFDLAFISSLQSVFLVHHPEMHYTGVSERMFHTPYIEDAYVNRVFEDFTGSDRIKYLRAQYPCELDVPENSAALVLLTHRIVSVVEWDEEDRVRTLATQFDRFVLDLVGMTNNTELRKMHAKDVVYQEVENFEDIRGEQMETLRRLLPDFELYILSDDRLQFIVYCTRVPGDREKILERYDLIGDRVVSDFIDRHWKYELLDSTEGPRKIK